MDARYWKEFENMGDMEADKHSDSEDFSPRYSKSSKKSEVSSRRKRSRTKSRSRSRSTSSSSSGSSSRSSSSSSRRHSDYRSRKQEKHYSRASPSRVRSSSYGSGREEGGGGWFPPNHAPSGYPNQGQDMPPSSSYIPPPYQQAPPPQGQYPPNFQGPNFGGNYHAGYPGYDSGPTNYYAPNFPHGSQPPPHEYGISGGPSGHPPANWEMFPDTTLPPPNLIQPPVSGDTMGGSVGPDLKTEEAKKEAIEQELLQQKRTLAKQREDYVRRKFSLNRELNRLKDQKRELMKEKSKDNERILRENAKLQGEIQQKLKSIDNVIEMLTNIIGDSASLPEVIKEIKSKEKSAEKPKKSEKKRHSPPEEREEHRSSETGKDSSPVQQPREENRVFYDPGLHWCSECNVFPKTVSHYLEHLHTPEHKQNSKMKFEDYPWHTGQKLREKSPQLSKEYPAKRIPIRGVQFLIPASAWFCSMCKVWLGDNHCASKHVQSSQHSQNYNEFIMRNPHWEVDWLTERTRSYERNSEAKQLQQNQRNPHSPKPVPPTSSSLSIASLSDQLLAMIAANNSKAKDITPPPPPPPPPLTKSSSSSSEEDSPDSKKKKRKKSKKRKLSKERKSPSKEKIVHQSDQIKLTYKSMSERKGDPPPLDDNFISEWMPRVEKHEPVQLKKKQRDDIDGKVQSKRSRRISEGSREPSSEGDKKPSPYDHLTYNDHDEAVIFDKRPQPFDRENSRGKKRIDERHMGSRYERESPKYKYKSSDKYRYEKEEREMKFDDHKSKKDFKPPNKEPNERERNKKSPFPRIKDGIEKKKLKAKAERTSDEDGHETSFEKRTSESALKKKDVKKTVLNNPSQKKLPFIGRMPILKKKVEEKSEKKDDKKEAVEEDGVKELSSDLMASETTTSDVIGPNVIDSSLEELPKSTLIISKRPRLAEPGIVKKEILFNKPANDNLTEQDMELDDDNGVPKEEEPAKDELHKDFKDALDLLFPEEKKKEEGEESEKAENEVKLEEQQQVAAVAGYMMPPGYDVSMYPAYYDQQAYVQQQWAQMGYDQAAQYPGAYAYPPPIDPASIEAVVQQPTLSTDIPPSEPKKKKNAPSQRMRRHLQKKKAKEEAANKSGEEIIEGEEEGKEDEDDSVDDDNQENGEEENEISGPRNEPQKASNMSMSDLAMLGIDEDDAAAQGFF